MDFSFSDLQPLGWIHACITPAKRMLYKTHLFWVMSSLSQVLSFLSHNLWLNPPVLCNFLKCPNKQFALSAWKLLSHSKLPASPIHRRNILFQLLIQLPQFQLQMCCNLLQNGFLVLRLENQFTIIFSLFLVSHKTFSTVLCPCFFLQCPNKQ